MTGTMTWHTTQLLQHHSAAYSFQIRAKDQQEQSAVGVIMYDTAANTAERNASVDTHSSDMLPANTSAGHT
jgi:hypothetical protein